MNNYFLLFKLSQTFFCAQTLGAGLIMLFRLFMSNVLPGSLTRFPPSQGSAAIRMMLLLHPPKLKQTYPFSAAEFTATEGEFLSKLPAQIEKQHSKKHIPCSASGSQVELCDSRWIWVILPPDSDVFLFLAANVVSEMSPNWFTDELMVMYLYIWGVLLDV